MTRAPGTHRRSRETVIADELVHFVVDGGVATITLDSPQNRNALSRRLVAELAERVERALGDPTVRVVLLTGAGPVFCSGADLKEQRAANAGGNTAASPTGVGGVAEILLRIWNAPKPFVCRVNGAARAGGLGLVAACDISVGVETASFAFSEVRIGVAPAIISVVTLPRLGVVKGMELMLTGEPFSAAEAVSYGLLNACAPAEGLDAAVGGYIEKLLKGGPKALAATKALVREVPGMAVAAAFEAMARRSAELFASSEALEGMSAFAERRDPRWV